MKKTFMRLLCLLLCLSLMGAYVPAAEAMQEGSGEIVEISEVEYIDQVESSESFLSLDGGRVALKPGNYERWIDRLELSDAQFALDFYDWLEANIDGALVDPTGCPTYKGNYVYMAKVNTGTISFTYDTDPGTAAADALNNGLPESLNDVKPYLVAVYSAFDRDHPEVFWLTGGSVCGYSVPYSYSYGGGRGTVTYTQNFYFYLTHAERAFDVRQEGYRTTASVEDAVSARYTAVDIILNKITATDPYGQVRQLNQILTTQNCYNSNVSTAPDSAYECTSALFGSTGSNGPVCEGYSRAFKVLCDRLEIPCVLADGMSYNSGGSGPHMWNNVQMPDGNWYAVDVTWNDPVVSGKTGAVSGYENENYLLVGGDTVIGGRTFSASHVVENSVTSSGPAFTNGPVLASAAYVPATGLTLSQSTLYLYEGETALLTAAATPSNASGQAVWSSDNPAVATVADGKVTAVSEGTAVITARIGDVSAQCVVTVEHIHGYAGVITTQPTCTAEGVMTYTCTCSDSYTESIPTVDHNYVDGTCTACGAYEAPVLKDGYYEIATANQLYWFAQRVSSGYTHINGKLVADITINTGVLKADGTLNGDGSNFRVWTPIGVSSNYYQGTFDGDGHTVSGVYYVGIEDVGFFSRTNGATIQNLHIADSYFRGQTYVGAVIGTSYGGTVIGCTSSATVDCGTEYASSMITGGIVGYGDGTVENCENLGLVIGDAQVGGIVGENYGTIKNCVNSGNVKGVAGVGGIAGGNSKTITDCGNTAKITATYDKIGGVVGNNSGTVTFCYNTASVSGSSGVGGVAGNNERGTITSCYNTGYISGSYAVGGVVGQNKKTIGNCYNVGGVKSTSNYAGGVVGKQVSGAVTGCAFRNGCAMDGKNTIQTGFGCDTLGSAAVNQPAQTACYSDFTTGEVAYFLQSGLSEQVWGQNLDNGEEFQGCPCFSNAVVYQVTNCKGETVYSNHNENVPHTYENGVCIVCGADDPNYKPVIEKFDIAFSQVDMGNALGMNFAFPAVEDIDFTGAYAEATMAGSTQTIPADKWTTATIGGKTHYVFGYSNIAAKQMADEVTIVIYNANNEAISNEYIDSIQSYVMRNVDKKDDESKALMIDMLNYGAAAQSYYKYNTSDLANALLTDAQKAYGTAELTEITDIRVKGANYLGTRLELGSSIGMQMNFVGTTANMYAVIEFTNHSGVKVSERVAPTLISGSYLIVIDQIVVADGRMPITVTVYNADGTVYGSATDSMASYIARMSNADSLYENIMKFSDSAYAYLH